MLGYLWFGAQIALAWFFLVNLAASAIVGAVQHGTGRTLDAPERSWVPMFWRLLPAAASSIVTCGLAIPAFAWLEPRDTQESLGWVMRLLALGGGVLAIAALARGMIAVRQNARALLAATASRAPISLGLPVPAYVVRGRSPLLLLAGILRPRLFVSEGILEALTREELQAALAHELAHHRAADNLKRALLAFAPDALAATPLARRLESRWRAAAEQAADADAAGGDKAAAVALAGALVKVARLHTGPRPQDCGCAAFTDGQPIARRVRRLLADAAPSGGGIHRPRLLVSAAVAMVLGAAAWLPDVLRFVHGVSEAAVRLP